MKKNVGNTDRIVRILLALIFGGLYVSGTVTGTTGLVMLVLGIVFIATSALSFCPIYALVGLNTCPAKK